MTHLTIELVYFDGCPNAEHARANVRAALQALELPRTWKEWDHHDAETPDRFRRFGSPTVLVNGADITGVGEAAGATCRADGAPSVATIQAAIQGAG